MYLTMHLFTVADTALNIYSVIIILNIFMIQTQSNAGLDWYLFFWLLCLLYVWLFFFSDNYQVQRE